MKNSPGNNFSLAGNHVDQIHKTPDHQLKFTAAITFIEISEQPCGPPFFVYKEKYCGSSNTAWNPISKNDYSQKLEW